MDNICNLTTGLHWRSPSLEMALGPIRKGNFVMLAGFVDSGKTTLGCSEFTYMASQLPTGTHALWFNNEEEGDTVVSRLIQAAIGRTTEWIDRNRDDAFKEYSQAMCGDPHKIVFIDSANGPITPGLIRKKLREYNTGLMCFDQLYKVRGFKRNGDDKLGQLQDIFEYGRQLAKQYCPVMAIHQARGDANGLQKIEMHQLAGSQQALQGELDAIVTIGRDLAHPHMRYLYVPKNKLPTPGDKGMRNGFFDVQPQFEIARFDT
jgi:replicative DNA helicase